MNKRKNTTANVRKQAQRRVEGSHADTSTMTPDDVANLVHELETYQLQLEVQNKELRRVQEELQESRDRYLDLYDYAPLGYFTINKRTNLITEVNLTACSLLGIERSQLLKTKFTKHIDPEFTNTYYCCRKRAIKGLSTEECEIRMCRGDGASFWARLEILVFPGTQQMRVAILDITERKRLESELTYLAAFPELNPNPVLEVNEAGQVTYLNPAAKKLFPDLVAKNRRHPFLANWKSVVDGLRSGKTATLRRDLCVQEHWYEQAVTYLASTNSYRLYARDITVRKIAEETLAAANAELNAVYANVPIAMMLVDRERRVWKLNQAAANFSSRQPDEMIGLRGGEALRCLHSLDDPEGCGFGAFCKNCKIRQAVADTFNTGKPQIDVEAEFPLIRNGEKEKLWLLVSTTLLQIDSTEMVLFCARDITEHKKAEETLRESHHDLNRAQAVAKTGSWRMDVRHNELLWSEENHRIFGIPPGTPMTYETFLSCVHPADRAYVNRKWQAALQGEDYDIEHRIILGDEVRWVRERAELEFDDEGVLKGGFGTTQDITQYKRMEQQLEFHNSILAQVSDIVIAVDNEQRVTYYNKAAERTYHIKIEDALGRELREIYQCRWLRPEDEPIYDNALASQGFWAGENIHVKENGEEILVESAMNMLKDESGTQIGTLAVIRDITQRKRVEQIKDEFIGLVSHELKTPLTVVTGAVKTAMDERVSPEERHELLEDAAWGAESLDNILNNLLELSRYQADRLRLDKELVSIKAIVGKVIRAARNQHPRHVFSLDIPSGLRPINVDPVRLERILTNLIDNAGKYSPEGSEVRVFARREKDETTIGVSDQGVGISPEDQKNLFEPFRRLGIETKTEGIGLGLVVCKRLVEAHGGRIWLKSKPGEGTTFFFTLGEED